MDKFESMQVFIEVAKQQSFASASQALGMSAPATTRAIAALENRLGVKLFNRTTRHVRLTESGKLFLDDAKRIIEDVNEAEDAVAGIYTKPSGLLHITAPVLFGEMHVIPIIAEYLDTHPDVSVKANYHDRLSALLEEELDVAIRIGHLKDSSLYAVTVGHVYRITCGSPEYFKKHGKPRIPSDLQDHHVIFPSTFETSKSWQFYDNNKNITVKLKPRLYCSQNSSAIHAALLHQGITRLMSYQAGEVLKSGKLERVLAEYEATPIPINVIHLEGRRTNAKTRAFIDLAVTRLRENPLINSK